jgi:hypothetical protein
MLDSMSKEKARLEVERDEMSNKLNDIEGQLKAIGIEDGTSGLTQLMAQLYAVVRRSGAPPGEE